MKIRLYLLASLCSALSVMAADLPKRDQSLGSARVKTEGSVLTVSTGGVTRQWKWTEKGFLTQSVKNADGAELLATSGKNADWDLGDLGAATLISLKAFEDDDEHFTTKHLTVEAEIKYAGLQLKYVIWAYPGAPGLRTQLWLKAPSPVADLGPGISETLKLKTSPDSVFAWGYTAGLKADKNPYEVLATEPLEARGKSENTSGLMIQYKAGGMILIKESHAHLSIPKDGCAVGGFIRDGLLFQVDGLGIRPADLSPEYKFCWANWMVLFEGDDLGAQLALKQFDRFRYPVHPERDIFIMANTWGSEDAKNQCSYKAREENVLREIAACANLGVDILQIDDGWQDRTWLPAKVKSLKPPKAAKKSKKQESTDEVDGDNVLLSGQTMPPIYDVYPNGFGNVRDAAKAAGIRLGLWFAWKAPIEAIKTNMDNGDFKSIKFDFARLGEKSDLDYLYNKGRETVKYSGYTAVVNWDVTEATPRMGFYFGRDCGNLYLENRKASTVRSRVLYNPWQILRDAWMLAKYTNLNKIQLTYQNKDYVPAAAVTDAREYPHDYNLAITLMSSPIIFIETQMLSEEAVGVLKPLIAKYKADRDEMYKGYVFSIGDMPDNASWTGLQNHNPDTGRGYLMIFRELKNGSPKATMALHFLKPGGALTLTNVLTGKSEIMQLNQRSEVEFTIPQAPGFLFLKY